MNKTLIGGLAAASLGFAVEAPATEVALSGLIEVEASTGEDFAGEASRDVALATVELAAEARINPWTRAAVVYLHEEDDTEPGEIDQGILTFGNEAVTPVYLAAGRMYVPFGRFESAMVSDPLTLELGETRESAMEVGVATGGLYGSVYAFNGETQEAGEDETDQYGLNLGYAWKGESMGFGVGASYISSLAEADAIGAADPDGDGIPGWPLDALSRQVGGMAAHLILESGPWNLIGEYVGATEAFDAADLAFNGSGARPTAWNLEAGYTFELAGRHAGVALGYQATDEAVALGLPESRTLATFSLQVAEGSAMALEYAADEDYDEASGNSAHTVTLQLAAEF